MKTYNVSPSDITFLWSDCPRCFYRKVAQKIERPKGIFPAVFNRIDQAMKSCFLNRNLREFSEDYPDAVFKYPGQWVQSKPVKIAGHDIEIVFRGRVDGILEFTELGANGKPIMGVPDFKTTEANDDTRAMYGLALHTYAYCLENPADGEFGVDNVETLGLIVFEPTTFEQTLGSEPMLHGNHVWVEFEKDMDAFKKWMGSLAKVLVSDTPPNATEKCSYCNFFEEHMKSREEELVSA